MPQQIVIAEQLRIAALLTDERIDELIVAQGRYQIGDVFLGTVENVLPGIDAAFVNIGESEKNGFIHVSDLGPLRLKKGAAGITELLEPRQKVLVQVMKEPTGSKGPRLTGNIALPGRYLVLQPHGQGVNISRRINSEIERNRLRALGVLVKPPGTGLLIRSEAGGISEELLIDDLEALLNQWEGIQQAAEIASPPTLLNRDEDFIHRILRDHISQDLIRVILDNQSSVERVKNFLKQDGANVQVEAHNQSSNLLEHYRINQAIRDALNPRVDLPSGGYVIIEPTEALTVIDVNSGSFTRSANARETVLWTNCEAAIEIARQLKLRNIGGVIIIDFIDMESRRDQLQLLEHFTNAVQNDSARPQIAQLTELGLVELTRKRQGQNIYELFGKQCPNCGGLGNMAVLPETQPLTALEINQTTSSSQGQEDTLLSAENNIAKRKRGRPSIGHNSQSINFEEDTSTALETEPEESSSNEESNTSEIFNNRLEPELIAISMDEDQENVFSWLGLNPIILLDPVPENDNLLVRVVRPGQDKEVILEEAREELLSNNGKRRRKWRNGSRGAYKNTNELSEVEESANNELQVSNDHSNIEGEINSSIEHSQSTDSSSIEENKSESTESEPDDLRRRRRRSSANG